MLQDIPMTLLHRTHAGHQAALREPSNLADDVHKFPEIPLKDCAFSCSSKGDVLK